MQKNKKEKMVFYKGGYMPIEKAEANEKIHKLLDNPPVFEPDNNIEIIKWLKKIKNLYKS